MAIALIDSRRNPSHATDSILASTEPVAYESTWTTSAIHSAITPRPSERLVECWRHIGIDIEKDKLEDRLENFGRIYQSDKNPNVQEVWLLGRYHGQQHWSDGSEGRDIGWENRRYRMGGQAAMFDGLTLHAQVVSGFDLEPFYNGFTELWAQWSFDDMLLLTVGQQKHRFTHDRNVSSRYINTLERGQLLNMFAADYTPAVTLSGRSDDFSYYTGIFSNATGPDMWQAFTEFDSGYSLLAASIHNISDAFVTDSAHWTMSYLYSEAKPTATNLNRYGQGLSGALILTDGGNSLVTEVLGGLDGPDGDAFGINIQPGRYLTERIQIATRYQFSRANEPDGLIAQRRYEQPAGLTRGDEYHAFYIGLNNYLAGHRMKLIHGLEYADLSGQHLWTVSFAFRVFWGPHSSGPFPMNVMLTPD